MNMLRRCLAFDYGLGSTGVAVGDIQTGVVQSLGAIKMDKGRINFERFQPLINDWRPDIFLVGLPLHADGRVQSLTQQARSFSKKLSEYFLIECVEVDERYSTVDARDNLFNLYGRKGLSKAAVDGQSAALICQQWLNMQTD